jgi:hypothetical protein
MDKHDRPYRCSHAACAKLQGFTYSGGLLRHEREVHGKHGGPKSQMMCPYADCKRHSGKGFTRKENLNEHIRRVHENKPQQASQSEVFKSELQQAAQGAEQITELMELPPHSQVYHDPTPDEPEQPPPQLGKRKRPEADPSESVDPEDLREENKRLRISNDEKDDRLRELEAAQALSQSQLETLQSQIQRLKQEMQNLRNSQQQRQPESQIRGEQTQQDGEVQV